MIVKQLISSQFFSFYCVECGIKLRLSQETITEPPCQTCCLFFKKKKKVCNLCECILCVGISTEARGGSQISLELESPGCEPPDVKAEMNPGSLKGQQALSTMENFSSSIK